MTTGRKGEVLSVVALALLGITTACAAQPTRPIVAASDTAALAPAPTPNTHEPSNASWAEYQGRSDHNAIFPNAHLMRVRWRARLGGKINSGLAIVNGVLYTGSFDHGVYALDVQTGRMLWRTMLPNVVMSTPAVSDGIIVVGTGTNHSLIPPANASHRTAEHDAIYAISISTGQILWRYATQGEDMPSPAIYHNSVLFANGDRRAYALDLHNGHLIWKARILGAAAMDAAQVDAGAFFVGSCLSPTNCETRALSARSGATLWTNRLGSADATPAISNGILYTSSLALDEHYINGGRTTIAAINERTGKTLWTWAAPHPGACSTIGTNMRNTPGTVVRGVLYQPIGCSHEVLAFAGQTGKVIWSFNALGPVKMGPIVNGRSVYFGDTEGTMYQLDKRTGQVMLAVAFSKPFTDSPPVIVGRTMFVADSDFLYAFPLPIDRIPREIPIRNYNGAAGDDVAE